MKEENLMNLYISLNKDYINIGTTRIDYGSALAETQRDRLNLVWKKIKKILESD